jgi:3-methyladenine DNA glycosylase AlkD
MNDKSPRKSAFTKKIEQRLRSLEKPKNPNRWEPSGYIVGKGQSELSFLNITTPQARSILNDGAIYAHPFADLSALWFETNLFEAKSVTLYWLEKQPVKMLAALQKKIIALSRTIDNWAHADALCSLLAQIYEYDSSYLNGVFTKWNSHKNSWYRRMSMVSLFYYSRSRKKLPSYALAEKMVKTNLLYPEYYVQKGVGWTIREMYNVYPEKTVQFIHKNISNISSVAWVATSEKLPLKQKKSLLALRKRKNPAVEAGF